MDATKAFHHYLNKFVEISDHDFKTMILPFLTIRKFAKKELITRVGERENWINFIGKGLIRKFYLKGEEEINTQISMEGHIIHSQESFHSRTASEYSIETIEPSIVVSSTFDQLEAMFAQSQQMEHMGRMIITHTMVIKDRWQMLLVKLSPRERFIHFVTRNPEMLQRVPQKFLASYLNIKPETFSRFKHLIKGVKSRES
ncbi:MAG: Crp/Fnr family transcriptional regulator [Chitinophagaceae bacterium]|nr:Crp/Fnr family transcriptional regulator [Chitinophagaceae bacterium]MBP6589987.1 Crp/Fnr family transcriptional regulator [Chitinophagaceae bacterium]MBP8243708.1 Crp/Fnr family transcriptional regulator [Chitinophagaceae bacterium]